MRSTFWSAVMTLVDTTDTLSAPPLPTKSATEFAPKLNVSLGVRKILAIFIPVKLVLI